jgi:hypothetical protein
MLELNPAKRISAQDALQHLYFHTDKEILVNPSRYA